MVRKRRTEHPGGGESSDPQETGAGRGAQRPPQQHQQEGSYQGGRGGWGPQRGGHGGQGGGAPRGGMAPQQSYGHPEYQQGRGAQQYQRGGAPLQRRGGIGGRGAPSGGGPPRPLVPELHQATQLPYQAIATQPMSYPRPVESPVEAGSSSRQPEQAQMTQQLQKLTLQPEAAPTQAIQPASSKSMRFPLRPGPGRSGTRCIVKANHFFAELPDKDLHQYDVRFCRPSVQISFICLDFDIISCG